MPRLARPVFPGVPHHITQRGNRREEVFFSDEDRAAYLGWLDEYCAKHKVSVLAYCLMTNHIHVVAVPEREDALEKVFRPLHTRYAQRINRAKRWRGHLWQGRFFSSALDETYLWAAIRYVERNPVRARIVRRAENYQWSSAAAHCGLKQDAVLTNDREWLGRIKSVGDWSKWLAEGDLPEQLKVLRRHVERGLPCGAEGFIRRLERRAGQMLRLRARGRPKKVEQKD
jgi:putative transposase